GRIDVAAAALEEDREAAQALLDHPPRGARVVGRRDHRARSDRDRVGRVTEQDRDRHTVEVVDPDDTDGLVDRMLRHLAEDVAAVAELAPVDADAATAPARADARRLEAPVGLDRRLD